MNKVILIGNLTRDPELTQTPSGVSVCKFTIAVNRSYANSNGEREADFINIVAWRVLADNCGKFLSKGSKVGIVGELQTRSYDDRNGDKRYATEVIASEVEFISTTAKDATERMQTPEKPRQQMLIKELKPVQDDGLPF